MTKLFPLFFLITCLTSLLNAEFTCTYAIGSRAYNLTLLNSFTIELKKTPYTHATETISMKGNYCHRMGQGGADDCPKDAWACIITTIQLKNKNTTDTLDVKAIADASVNPTVTTFESNLLQISYGPKLSIQFVNEPGKKTPTVEVQTFSLNDASEHVSLRVTSENIITNNGSIGKGPGSSSMSGWGVFFLTIFVILIIYFVLGSAYNIVINKIFTFPDFIPNVEFWSSLLSRLLDFVSGLLDRIRGRSNYVSI